MRRRLWKSMLTFVLVLVLTVVTVATLSMATAAKTETASARYSQEVRQAQAPTATELSANVREEGLSFFQSFGAFALMLTVPALGLLVYSHSRRKGKAAGVQGRRAYSPRADRAFRNEYSARRV